MAFQIKTVENLKYFPNMIEFQASYNVLTTIDLSYNPLLTMAWFADNNLTTLDLSNNLLIEIVYVTDNNLNTLILNNNFALQQLYARSNNLTQLSVDYILNKLDQFGLSGLPELRVDLVGNSPASATGLISASNLIAKGWNVDLQA